MTMAFENDVKAVDALKSNFDRITAEVKKVIIGQDDVVKSVMLSIFSGGHCLLVGVPGLAKTLLVNTIADALGLQYSRIQFTPDLMPSDITGSEILNEKREFRFVKGPIKSLSCPKILRRFRTAMQPPLPPQPLPQSVPNLS